MISYTCIEFEGRWLVVRRVYLGGVLTDTVECDCLTQRTAHTERNRLCRLAEAAERREILSVESEAKRESLRRQWTGQKVLF